ncbi:hypothetical protein [Streptomyces candidus]|uniref:Alanine-rich protein n=1 Tax=Streptomyces candidus TaxID=67283 RepID=A0A7X0LTF7_9ACTN|nr:hypothetical protein [Streptomyces candidus]MBB6438976.1 hypothetical protein [Streptomyces candidus]GHH44469.1 hypothetical protein GCM10018773_32130 [Streptomyces candidus]
MRTAVFLYPWDVVGDPDAAARIADLGVRQVTLAAAYHSTRALTPRHPRHRIVTADHAAVLYEPDATRWSGRPLRPYPAGAWAPGDTYAEAADALQRAGIDVHSWVVLAHNSRLGTENPDIVVRNAYGDRYPWAPCIARPEVQEYLAALAAEAAVRPGARGTELESCGWYGLAHLHAHDKTGGVALGDAAQYLMSLCFCTTCRTGYTEHGADPDVLASAVRQCLKPLWSAGGGTSASGWPAVVELLGTGLAAATLGWRTGTARVLQELVLGAVRAAAAPGFQVLLHADPAPYRSGANPGVDPAHLLSIADGAVLPCSGGGAETVLPPFVPHREQGSVIAANFSVVAGMGGSPDTLVADARRAQTLGANELRLYHAGLASDADLRAVRESLRVLI